MSMSILHSLPAYKVTTFSKETILILHHIVALFTIQFIYYIIQLWHQLYYLFNLLLYDVRSFIWCLLKNDTSKTIAALVIMTQYKYK